MAELLLTNISSTFTKETLGDMLASPLTFPPVDSDKGPLSIVRTIDGDVGSLLVSHHGVNHCHDPEAKTISEVKAAFKAFEAASAHSRNRVALVEGVASKASTERECILNAGESGLVHHLGRVMSIAVVRAEPPNNSEASDVFSRFSKEEAILFYVTRRATQHHQLRKDGATNLSMKEYMQEGLRAWQERLRNNPAVQAIVQLTAEDFSYKTFERTHNELLGVPPFKENDDQNDYLHLHTAYVFPAKQNAPVSRITEFTNKLRGIYKADLMLGYLAAGRNVFQAQGWFHARALEPVVRNAEHILSKV